MSSATKSRQEDDYYIGLCLFAHTVNNTDRMYIFSNASQLDGVMCGSLGLLCGECKDGYGPAI